jgi:predicted dehydrogenase
MIRIAVVGLGKMGISHLAMINAHPGVQLVAVCDTTTYLLTVLNKYTGITVYSDFSKMLAEVPMDGVILATPSASHYEMARMALDRGISIFCEKPFTLNPAQSNELAAVAASKNVVNQVGYHNRFVGTFCEVKRLLDLGAIGKVSHSLAEAYGPVVLRPKSSTWRTQRQAGGGCLYDYAAHPINLLNWYFGAPSNVSGTVMNQIFSTDTDDEIYSTLSFASQSTAQLSVNWSDDSQRKMTTKISLWGTNGRISADRQEVQVYLREKPENLTGYQQGWNTKYTTELTKPVWFYLRGEEYSSQLDYFVDAIVHQRTTNVNSFQSAAATDQVIDMLLQDCQAGRQRIGASVVPSKSRRLPLFRRIQLGKL